ncbi:Os02g0101300, partial [Oryza sativa Japonica Group]
MGAASSSMQHLFLLCRLLGFCFAFTASQQQQSDSCSSAGVAVAHLAFCCLTVWKQEDFVLRVCMLLNFAVLPVIGILLR